SRARRAAHLHFVSRGASSGRAPESALGGAITRRVFARSATSRPVTFIDNVSARIRGSVVGFADSSWTAPMRRRGRCAQGDLEATLTGAWDARVTENGAWRSMRQSLPWQWSGRQWTSPAVQPVETFGAYVCSTHTHVALVSRASGWFGSSAV